MLPFMNIAHRGLSGYYPENTMVSFQQAWTQGFTFIECDLRLSRDKKVVVIHDRTVDRTTNGEGLVCTYSLRELKQLDAGSWFDARFSGEAIPTLSELLAALPSNVTAVLEIKDGYYFPEILDLVISEIKSSGLEGQIHISSFHMDELRMVKERCAEMVTSALIHWNQTAPTLAVEVDGKAIPIYAELDQLIADAKKYGIDIICPQAQYINSELVRKLHNEGFLVRAWGLKGQDKAEMQRLVKIGIDGMTTDFPDLLSSVRENVVK